MTERPPRWTAAARLFAASAALAALGAALPALAGSNSSLSGSAYVDYWWLDSKSISARSPAGMTIDASLKVGVDINDDLAFSAKACMSCHGIDLEHASIDWMPSTKFNVQAGRLAVPFGEYSNRVDPSGHKTVSAPLIFDMGRMVYGEKSAMNLGVLPLPYVDTGVMLYGQLFLGGVQAWYGAYATSGYRGGNDLDFMAMRSTPYTDNNRVPAGGGRVVFTWASEGGSFLGDVSLGGSATMGRYDKGATLEYRAWGADASIQLGKAILRGEYATRTTQLDPKANYAFALVDDYFVKEGWYAELEHPVGRWFSAVYRYDELRRRGVPLPSANAALSTDSLIKRYTAGVMILPAPSLYAKIGVEYWQPTDFPELLTAHVGFGGSF
jgi:hypothetical protein